MSAPIAQLGFAIVGGVLGGAPGFAIANLVGGLIFGPKNQGGGSTAQQLQAETSEYGVFIKEFYGSMLTSGNIIDCRYKDGKPHGITTSKKKISAKGTGAGAPATETEIITYYLTAAYLLGKGPLDVDKIWMEDDGEKKLIYNRYGENKKKRGLDLTPELDQFGNVVAELSDRVQIYRGLESQPVNPILQDFHPDGVPAYRGTAYVLFNKLKIKSVPRFTFLVRNAITGRKEIVEHRLQRAGIPASRIEMGELSGTLCGAVVAQREGAAALSEKVAITSLCDIAFIDGLIVDKNRQNPITFPLAEEELGAFEVQNEGDLTSAPDSYKLTTINATDLPSRFKVGFQNVDIDYAQDSAPAERTTAEHINEQSLEFPIAAHYEDMAMLSKVLIDEMWATKDSVEISLLPHRINAAPGDVYIMPEEGRYRYLRIGEQQIGPDGLLYHKTNSYDFGVYGQYPVGYKAPYAPSEVPVYDEPRIFIADVVSMTNEMAQGPGFISGVSVPSSSAWNGAQLQSEGLGDVGYPFKAIIGNTLTSYFYSPEETTRINYDKTIRIRLLDGELSSTTEEKLRNNRANALLIGELLIQFVTAEQVDDNEWELSGIVPGRDGSDYVTGALAGTPVMLITDENGALEQGVTWTPLPYTSLGQEQEYSVVMDSMGGEFIGPLTFTPRGNSIKPLSPVRVQAERVEGVSVTLSVSPRTRLQPNASWALTNQSDPLDFRFEITGGLTTSLVKNTTNSRSATFSWAELEAYFGGSVPHSISGLVRGNNNLIGLGFPRYFQGL